MQLENFSVHALAEPHDKRIWRLRYKWLIESEIWLTSLIIVELL